VIGDELMTSTAKLAPHETIELRELLMSEVVGAKKIQSSLDTISDNDLKAFMKKSLDGKISKIENIQVYIETN
jgi:hypothetical protein